MAIDDRELVRRVDELRSRLISGGNTRWSEALADAIGGGATGTEILGRLAVTLDGVRRDRAAVGRDDRRRAARLRRAVVRLLRRPQ